MNEEQLLATIVGRTVALFPMEISELLVQNGVVVNSDNLDTSALVDGVFAGIFGSEKFRNFISIELFQEINKRYRTSNKKGILGESLSGLFVVETFFLKPEMFDYYIAFDPSLWWNNQFLVRNSNKNLNDSLYIEKTFWFAGSGVEDISVSTNQFNKILLDKNLKNLKWKYSDEPKEKHSTIFRATKEKALIWTLNMK
jgi:predicted alpha/beta superfamily hydrolase